MMVEHGNRLCQNHYIKRCDMELMYRVVIVSMDNMIGIKKLYGKCTQNELECIVNSHISFAIQEINEDINT